MSVINLKALFNDLKNIQKYDVYPFVPGCNCCGPTLDTDKNIDGDWIRTSDLQKILDEYGDDASLKD